METVIKVEPDQRPTPSIVLFRFEPKAERLPETCALKVNEAANKKPTTLDSSRETDALETILKTSSSASPQSRDKVWSTNYPSVTVQRVSKVDNHTTMR